MSRFRTLLVDDVPELRRLLRHVLEWSDRFEVVGEADSGREGIDQALEKSPDLVLLDISMPVMDGMEALPLIREASPSSKIVMLSGFEAERLARSALDMGASAYIEKGTPPAALISRLLEVLQAGETEADDVSRRDTTQPATSGNGLVDIDAEEMMSLVAHEIRNPLAVIQGFGMELQNRWDAMPDHVRKDAVRRMTERSRYLNNVVNNLMYMRRIRQGPQLITPTVEHVAPLLEKMSEELRDLCRNNPIELDIEADLPAVETDLARLRQILTNLVVNAAKYAPEHTPIAITAARADGGVKISVRDQGPGIPAGKREEVFEKFRRLEEGGSGIGLGLFICRELVTSMRGEIWIEEAPGGGACVVCLLQAAEDLEKA